MFGFIWDIEMPAARDETVLVVDDDRVTVHSEVLSPFLARAFLLLFLSVRFHELRYCLA